MHPINLKALMQGSHVTIRGLAAYMGITQKRVRAVRNGHPITDLAARDFREAVEHLAARKPDASAQVQIVVATVEEIQEGRRYAGRPWGPQQTVRQARAAMWLRKGGDTSIGQAHQWADANGYQVFTFDLREDDPLGKAKAAILAQPAGVLTSA